MEQNGDPAKTEAASLHPSNHNMDFLTREDEGRQVMADWLWDNKLVGLKLLVYEALRY